MRLSNNLFEIQNHIKKGKLYPFHTRLYVKIKMNFVTLCVQSKNDKNKYQFES